MKIGKIIWKSVFVEKIERKHQVSVSEVEGKNEIESVNDLKMELIDLYEDMNQMEDDELGNEPKSWKKTINRLIKKCQ